MNAERILYPDGKKQKIHEESGHEKGFTQIPNKVITEILIKGLLNLTEIRIVFYIIRFSVGFHKDWTDKITVQKIAKDTGISRPLCSTTINQMIRENKLLKNEGRFKFNDEYNTRAKVLTNPVSNRSGNLTESVNKKEQLVLTNPYTREPNNNAQITTLKNSKESIKEMINKIKRKIKERKICPRNKFGAGSESISEITFNKQTFRFENVPEEKLEKWKEAFPFINVEVELKKMEAWLTANPKRLKKNYEKFIVNWLKRTKGGKNERYISLSRRTIEKGSEGKSYEPGKW